MAKDKKTNKGPLSFSKEDMSLWRKVASTVQRYLPAHPTHNEPEDFAALMGDLSEKQAQKQEKPTAKTASDTQEALILKKESPSKAPDIHSGVDGRTLSKLRKGQLPLESVLDLHGMTLDKAHAKCINFLKASQGKGYRCVLIITGKGTFSKEKIGIIKKHFPEWMHEDPLSKIVLAFSVAQAKDGGTGAFYVLLRKAR